jgi:hypothetical protein
MKPIFRRSSLDAGYDSNHLAVADFEPSIALSPGRTWSTMSTVCLSCLRSHVDILSSKSVSRSLCMHDCILYEFLGENPLKLYHFLTPENFIPLSINVNWVRKAESPAMSRIASREVRAAKVSSASLSFGMPRGPYDGV